MKPILFAFILVATLAVPSIVHAQGSMLRVACEGNDIGADVTIDGKFKGECPLDIQVGAGTVKLRAIKKVDSTRERVFEQDIRLGDGVVKKVDVVLSAPRLIADAQSRESERLALERAESAKRGGAAPAPPVTLALAAPSTSSFQSSTRSGLGSPASIAALPLGPVSSSFPSRAIRLVVPFPPGGAADIMARTLAQKMSELAGQPVIIENRAGTNTVIGTDLVAKAPADGYTLLAAASNFAVNPGMYSTLPFDAARSFAPITMIGAAASILVVNRALPVPMNAVRDLIALGKSRPSTLTYGSFGTGSTSHFAAEMFGMATGTKLVHVPYKGPGPALTDLMAGRIQLVFASPVGFALPHIKSGTLRALAVTSTQRSSQAPDIPTLAEAGVANFEMLNWTAILAPAGTPRDVVNKLNQLIVRALNTSDLKDKYAGFGMDVWAGSPDGTRDYINAEIDKYRQVAKAGGIQADQAITNTSPTVVNNATPSNQRKISGGRTLSGIVAIGQQAGDGQVCARRVYADDLEDNVDCVNIDATGGFMFRNIRDYFPPVIIRAEFTVRNIHINLFTIAVDRGGDITAHVTPITDMITRTSSYDSTGATDDENVWMSPPPSSTNLDKIMAGVKKMLGPEAPENPFTDPLEPDPARSRYDRFLENTRIAVNAGKVTVADVTGKIMATTPMANIINNTVNGNEQTVTQEKAKAAEAATAARRAELAAQFDKLSVSPSKATLNQLTTFTVRGVNLIDGMGFTLESCSGFRELPGGTNTVRQFSCTPIASGPKYGYIKDQPFGTSLYLFHVAVAGAVAAQAAQAQQNQQQEVEQRPSTNQQPAKSVAKNEQPANVAQPSQQVWYQETFLKGKSKNDRDTHYGPDLSPPPSSAADMMRTMPFVGTVHSYKGCSAPCGVGSTITAETENSAYVATYVWTRRKPLSETAQPSRSAEIWHDDLTIKEMASKKEMLYPKHSSQISGDVIASQMSSSADATAFYGRPGNTVDYKGCGANCGVGSTITVVVKFGTSLVETHVFTRDK